MPLEQQENLQIKGSKARNVMMQKLLRKSEVKLERLLSKELYYYYYYYYFIIIIINVDVQGGIIMKKQTLTRMLAINVSIPNLTVARLVHFPSPQMADNKPSFTRKPHVVVFRQCPFAANAVPKLVAMATSLGPSISAMSSLDSLFPKTHPQNQTACRQLSYN